KRFAGGGLELAPEPIGMAHQRHITGVLEIAEPDHAGQAMRGAAVMAGLEALDAEDANAPFREMVERGASHRAQPDDQDIERHCFFAFSTARDAIMLCVTRGSRSGEPMSRIKAVFSFETEAVKPLLSLVLLALCLSEIA